jgi:hypothetical protein
VLDPDGHAIGLYFSMEQIGWDGKARPPALRRSIDSQTWPATIDARSDTFLGDTLLGPLG